MNLNCNLKVIKDTPVTMSIVYNLKPGNCLYVEDGEKSTVLMSTLMPDGEYALTDLSDGNVLTIHADGGHVDDDDEVIYWSGDVKYGDIIECDKSYMVKDEIDGLMHLKVERIMWVITRYIDKLSF